MRDLFRSVQLAPRRLTSSFRGVPDFLIIGAQKAGTTSLNRYLSKHPGVQRSFRKEVHYFDLNHEKGMSWYRAFFPMRGGGSGESGAVKMCGESSPYYLFHPRVPERVKSALPEVKLIVVLRDPVARAYSHYQHSKQKGYETETFEAALSLEEERLSGTAQRFEEDPSYLSLAHARYSYFSRGLYLEQLLRWREHFEAGQLLVLKAEDLYQNTQSEYDRCLSFLGLPPFVLPSVKTHNKRSYGAIDADVRADLMRRFEPHNEALYEFLGQDMRWGK